MNPKPGNRRQRLCAEIAFQLRSQLGGEAVVEAAVLTTSSGVRVPDVVWMPGKKWPVGTTSQDLLQAPVLVVGLTGTMEFHRLDGVHSTSTLNMTLTLPSHLFQYNTPPRSSECSQSPIGR